MPGLRRPAVAAPRESAVASMQPSSQWRALAATSAVISYLIVSSALIQTNKWLMEKDHFPYPVVLAVMHQFTTSLGAWLLYMARPAWFPAMGTVQASGSAKVSVGVRSLPIGAFFAGSVVCSNMAYEYCSVPFIQMLKEGNLVLVFAASTLLGLERFSRTSACLIAIVFFGATLAAFGEVRFSLHGVFFQLLSQVFEVSKVLGQNLLMSEQRDGSSKLDPLSVVLFTAPVALVFLVVLFVFVDMSHAELVLLKSRTAALWLWLVASSVLALLLNVAVACTIWSLNAVGFMLAGIAKDIVIVFSSVMVLHVFVSRQQMVGFSIAIFGITHYSLHKMHPECFAEGNPLPGFVRVYRGLMPRIGLDASQAEKQKLFASP